MAEKKLKKLSKKKSTRRESTAQVVKESASQIWLAGLGAFAKAQEEGSKIFEALVEEGREIESKTRQTTSARVNEVRGAVEGTVDQVRGRANESWDKLEKVFEERVAKVLNRLGVPTSRDVQQLTRRVEELQRAVDDYNRKSKTGSKATASKKKTTRKKATRKKSASKSKPASKS